MASIRMHTARTLLHHAGDAAADLVSQLDSAALERTKLVFVFASRDRDHGDLNRALRARLPAGTRFAGASTAGELDREGIGFGSVVLAALEGDLDVGLGLAEGLSVDASTAGERAIAMACEQLGVAPEDLDTRKHVAIVIDDGFRAKKEELLMGILERNQGLVLVGGGASDTEQDEGKRSAVVHVDGIVTTDAALVALIRTEAPWAAMRSHWFEPTGKLLRITKVDASHLRATEIDGRPAAERYAELLGVSVGELDYGLPRGFGVHPTAMKVGREHFIRGPWYVDPDGAILFANLLGEGVEYELMRRGDMVKATRAFFEEQIPKRVRNATAALLFNCSGRIWSAKQEGNLDQLSSTLEAAPVCAGMNVYFEVYCGFSINNTLTSLVFGSAP